MVDDEQPRSDLLQCLCVFTVLLLETRSTVCRGRVCGRLSSRRGGYRRSTEKKSIRMLYTGGYFGRTTQSLLAVGLWWRKSKVEVGEEYRNFRRRCQARRFRECRRLRPTGCRLQSCLEGVPGRNRAGTGEMIDPRGLYQGNRRALAL